MTKRRVYREPVVQPQDQSIRYIPLTKGQIATVDAGDYGWLNEYNWIAHWSHTSQSFYACRTHGGPDMHNVILGIKKGGDHWSHDTLDNRRINLRVTNISQQMMNRRTFRNSKTGQAGVVWHKRDEKWAVYINADKVRICLGYYPPDKYSEAVARRKAAEADHHGEFAYGTHQLSG